MNLTSSQSPLDLSALGGYKMTDTSSKGSKCLYESRFVQNVQFSFKLCLLYTMFDMLKLQ